MRALECELVFSVRAILCHLLALTTSRVTRRCLLVVVVFHFLLHAQKRRRQPPLHIAPPSVYLSLIVAVALGAAYGLSLTPEFQAFTRWHTFPVSIRSPIRLPLLSVQGVGNIVFTTGVVQLVDSTLSGNLSSNFVPGPQNLYPDRYSSTGNMSIVRLIKIGTEQTTSGTSLVSSFPTNREHHFCCFSPWCFIPGRTESSNRRLVLYYSSYPTAASANSLVCWCQPWLIRLPCIRVICTSLILSRLYVY